jgi:hypothetical protein
MARGQRRPDHHDAVVHQLSAAGCTRMEHVGDGAYRWYSPKSETLLIVEGQVFLRTQANAILQKAGLPPMFP